MNILKIALWLLTLGSVVILITGSVLNYNQYKIVKGSIKQIDAGTHTDPKTQAYKNSTKKYTINYSINNVQKTFILHSRISYNIDSTIDLYYLPSRPDKIYDDKGQTPFPTSGTPFILIIVGIVCFVIFTIAAVSV